MADMELDHLSLAELKKLAKSVEKAITSFEDRRKAEVRAEVEEVVRRHGFTLAELVDGTPPKLRRAAAPKYRHPVNPALTWSGRGRKPGWIAEALAGGKALEDFAI